ncbi:uncharacterized protein LOC110853530 [Folsomia candida]|uniref:uncharacterized protein LOC110853530 n=1 Tax=Folsomia candida TaxID=158441 RepID=UPI000B8F0084|nr:uncharacterized protein LOC110853530 [Folsomia candida]
MEAAAASSQSSDLLSDVTGRTLFLLDTPFFYILGYLLVAYFVIYFVAMYAGPMMTGSDPYYPYPSYPYRHGMPHSIKKRSLPHGYTDQDLISRVTNAIEGQTY